MTIHDAIYATGSPVSVVSTAFLAVLVLIILIGE